MTERLIETITLPMETLETFVRRVARLAINKSRAYEGDTLYSYDLYSHVKEVIGNLLADHLDGWIEEPAETLPGASEQCPAIRHSVTVSEGATIGARAERCTLTKNHEGRHKPRD